MAYDHVDLIVDDGNSPFHFYWEFRKNDFKDLTSAEDVLKGTPTFTKESDICS